MIWDDKMSITELKTLLNSRMVELKHVVEEATTAVIGCHSYEATSDALRRVSHLADDARELYEVIDDKELEQAGEELEKEYNKLTKEGEE